MTRCPVCQRSFAEPGFCPFDGNQLVTESTQPPTVVSQHHRAQSDTGPDSIELQVATRPGVGDPAHQLTSLSAHEGHAAALATIRTGVNEYDRLIGETLDGRYYVQRKIGEGGMGVVFAVKHTVIERPLAIKVLKRNVMRDNAVIQRFIQEAKAASRIGHPNIVDVTDFGKTPDGMTYSVMELVDGTTLSKTIKHAAPLPPERAVRIASQIARALAAAHVKGIVHRDLKPENVFLIDRDGRPDFVKIVDFGIAKVQPVEGSPDPKAPRLTRAGSVFGTPEYMAPEQASGRGDTDHRVDIYALGVILYEMLVGRVPFKGETPIRTIAMQMLETIPPLSEVNPDVVVPPALEAIVMKALEKAREDRFDSMAVLLLALDAIIATLATAAATTIVSEPAVEEPPKRARPATRQLHEPQFVAPGAPVSLPLYEDEPLPESKRWPLWLAGLLVLLVGAGGMMLLIRKLDSRDDHAAVERDAATLVEARDAQDIEAPIDGSVVVDLPPDAGTRVVATVPRDAGVRVLGRPDRKGNFTIEILTRPGEANVYIAPNFRGPGGVKITEPLNTKRHIECKTETMKGSIDVVFDGKTSAVMCTVSRARFCVPGLKPAPWEDCEEDPGAGP